MKPYSIDIKGRAFRDKYVTSKDPETLKCPECRQEYDKVILGSLYCPRCRATLKVKEVRAKKREYL